MSITKLLGPALILAAVGALAACDRNEGPFEEAGEEIDQAVEKAKDKAEEAKDEIRDATN